jgi:phage-related protein
MFRLYREIKVGTGYGQVRGTGISHVLAKNLVISCKILLKIEI